MPLFAHPASCLTSHHASPTRNVEHSRPCGQGSRVEQGVRPALHEGLDDVALVSLRGTAAQLPSRGLAHGTFPFCFTPGNRATNCEPRTPRAPRVPVPSYSAMLA